MTNPFVFNVLVTTDEKTWKIITQCDSAQEAEKRLAQFVEKTPPSMYRQTLITFIWREYRLLAWETYKEWAS